MTIVKTGLAAILFASANSAAFACPPPMPMPMPPDTTRIEGETEAAYVERTSQLIKAFEDATAARKAADEKAREDFLNIQIARDERSWDNAAYVVLARIKSQAPTTEALRMDVRYQKLALLKGRGKIGTLERRAFAGPLTSCGGYDSGLGDRNGTSDEERFLIFLDSKKPQPLRPEQIIPVSWLKSPRVLAEVALKK